MVKDKRYSDEALMEVFGTTGVDELTIIRWKRRWKTERGRVEVSSYNAAFTILDEAGVDPLFYQISADIGDGKSDSAERYHIVFFKAEHEVFFKLHAGMA